jgi:hypothetical protein
MTQYIVYEIEYLSDVDGRGPECIRSEVARFDYEEAAEDFAQNFNGWCEIVVED